MDQKITFNSKGETCSGVLTRPDGVSGPVPLVVMAGGWCYVKEMVLPHYAKFFHEVGFATLRFDYRNDGESTGTPRQHIDPWGQIEDYRNALSFAETLDDIDMSRTGVFGISYSGGHVLILSSIDTRPQFAISVVPVIDGFQTIRRFHGERQFARLQQIITDDRKNRFEGKPHGYLPMSSVRPMEEMCSWPDTQCYPVFQKIKETEAPNHQHRNTIESMELLNQYNVIPHCKRIFDTRVLMTIAKGDANTSGDLQMEAFNAITNPKKTLETFDVTHMSIYYDLDDLAKMGRAQAAWLQANFGASTAKPARARETPAKVAAE